MRKSINVINHKSKLKDKNHVMISIDVGKTFDKIYHAIIKKILERVELEGAYFNIITATQDQNIVSVILMDKKPGFRKETKIPIIPTLFQYSNLSTSWSNKTREENLKDLSKK